MTLKDLLKKKEKFKENEAPAPPQFTFVRTDTLTQEIISPPSFNESPPPPSGSDPHHHAGGRRLPHFRTASATTISSRTSTLQGERRLSRPLRLRSASSRASSVGSANVPFDLPSIAPGSDGSDDKEAQWEERATLLARGNPHGLPGGANADLPPTTALRELSLEEDGNGTRPKMARSVSDAQGDVNQLQSSDGEKKGTKADFRGE
ncbi:hypothetical protein MMC12_002874 [Toensbergia leucococca]|nr:hypothetical protein [Toensbergia leucococca]